MPECFSKSGYHRLIITYFACTNRTWQRQMTMYMLHHQTKQVQFGEGPENNLANWPFLHKSNVKQYLSMAHSHTARCTVGWHSRTAGKITCLLYECCCCHCCCKQCHGGHQVRYCCQVSRVRQPAIASRLHSMLLQVVFGKIHCMLILLHKCQQSQIHMTLMSVMLSRCTTREVK